MDKNSSFKKTLTLMLLASALTCVTLLMLLTYTGCLAIPSYNSESDYDELAALIKRHYIGSYDPDEIDAAAMKAAVESLGDRWSYYLTAEEYKEYLDDSNNRYAGIGVGVVADEETGVISVTYTYRGSPAETAGILAGDEISAVDGVEVLHKSLDDLRDLLARPIGQKAEITVIRDGESIVLTVVYDYIQIDPIWYEMLEGENGIGYVIIENFEYGAADGFISAVDDLLSQDARAFIFDVRGNGGGAVSEMTRILDYLLPEGEIFIAVDKDGKERVTTSKADFIDKPAVVLVDRYSFSAAEYFAATLGEYDYAPSVGEQTTGKNRSQTTHRMKNGGALHISSGMYLTRNRISLFDVGGLTPDHEIALSDEKFNQLLSGNLPLGEDDQLQFAISLLH